MFKNGSLNSILNFYTPFSVKDSLEYIMFRHLWGMYGYEVMTCFL